MPRLGAIPFLFITLIACEASRQPFEGMTMPSPDGCFVQVWDAPNFSGAADFINGPRVYPSLRDMPGGRRWDNRIRSVKVGPADTVVVWTDEKLQGMSMRLLKDSEYPRLSEALDSRVESMEIGCAPAGRRAAGAQGVPFRPRQLLGHLVNPTEPDSDDRQWIAQVWLNVARRTLGLPTREFGFERLPAVGRIAVTSPPLLQPFSRLNKGKHYGKQVKPFNFLSTCHVRPFGYPDRVRPEQFHLIAPYEPNLRRWLKAPWIDRYSGKPFHITTRGHHGGPGLARVQTYGEVIESYQYHPEAKFADAQGEPCRKQTVGLLQRRHVRIGLLTNIGKESNSLEEVQAGLVHDEENVYTTYDDPVRGYWQTTILPAVRQAAFGDPYQGMRGQAIAEGTH